MPKRVSKIASSLKQLGEVQVTNLDFVQLLNKDIRELEIARSLRRLGNIRVTEWDFRTVLPAVNKFANQEVDIIDIVRRTASYKVMEWDFRNPKPAAAPMADGPIGHEQMQVIVLRLKDFLQFVVINLIDEPKHAQIKVREIAPKVLRFKVVLVKRDVAMLIGREGHTASAIRSILKTAAGLNGVQALLDIHSHEEEMALGEGDQRD